MKADADPARHADATVRGAGPLYLQVRDILTTRIGAGQWQPGESLPSEMRLASALGVSQGTVRKAIDALVARNVLVRQQGKGTFVATHDARRALFHFFNLVADDGERALPDSRVLSCRRMPASREQAQALRLTPRARVIHVERVRLLDARATIVETVTVPAALFPDLDARQARSLPNALYALYESRFGITIHRAAEQLRAVPARAHEAALLGVECGHALLEIERLAYTLEDRPVELRVSRCDTRRHSYHNTVT